MKATLIGTIIFGIVVIALAVSYIYFTESRVEAIDPEEEYAKYYEKCLAESDDKINNSAARDCRQRGGCYTECGSACVDVENRRYDPTQPCILVCKEICVEAP